MNYFAVSLKTKKNKWIQNTSEKTLNSFQITVNFQSIRSENYSKFSKFLDLMDWKFRIIQSNLEKIQRFFFLTILNSFVFFCENIFSEKCPQRPGIGTWSVIGLHRSVIGSSPIKFRSVIGLFTLCNALIILRPGQ